MLDAVFFLPGPSPYWSQRISHAQAQGMSVRAVYLRAADPKGNYYIADKLDFPAVFIEGSPVRYVRELLKLCTRRPRMVLTFHFLPALWPLLLLRLVGVNITYYAEITFDSWVARSRYKEVAKHLLFRSAKLVLTPGSDGEAYIRRYRPNGSVLRLSHPVDVNAFAAAGMVRASSPVLRFLYIGRFVREKGLAHLIEAFDLHFVEFGGSELRMVGAGELDEGLKEWARRWPGRVSVEPYVDSDMVPSVMAGSDVLIFPTTGDPYGLVVNEAMASGMLVISSPFAGEIEDRLGSDGSRGIILDELTGVGLNRSLSRVYVDREAARATAERASTYARESFSLDVWTKQLQCAVDGVSVTRSSTRLR